MDKEVYKKILEAVQRGEDLSKMFKKEQLEEFVKHQIKTKLWSTLSPYLGYALIACLILGTLLAIFMAIFEFIGKLLGAFSEWWGYLWGGTVSLVSDDDVAILYYELIERGVDFDEVGGVGEHSFTPHNDTSLYSFLDDENLHNMAEEVLEQSANSTTKVEKDIIKSVDDDGNATATKTLRIAPSDCITLPLQVKEAAGQFPATENYDAPTVRDVFELKYWEEVVTENPDAYLKIKRADVVNVDADGNPIVDADGNEVIEAQNLKDDEGNDLYETIDEAAARLLTEMIIVKKDEEIDDDKYEESEYYKDKTNYPKLNVTQGVGMYLNKYLLAEINTFSARNKWTFAKDEFEGAIYISEGKEEDTENNLGVMDYIAAIINPFYGIAIAIAEITDTDITTIADMTIAMKSLAVERDDDNGAFYVNVDHNVYRANTDNITSTTAENALIISEKITEKYPITDYVFDYAMPWQYPFAFHENTLSPDVGYEVALMAYKYHNLWLQLRTAETGILEVYEGPVLGNSGSPGDFSQATFKKSQIIKTPRIYPRRIATWYETIDYDYDYRKESKLYPHEGELYSAEGYFNGDGYHVEDGRPTSSWFGVAAGIGESAAKAYYKSEYDDTKKDAGKAENYDKVVNHTENMATLTRVVIEMKKITTYVTSQTTWDYTDPETEDFVGNPYRRVSETRKAEETFSFDEGDYNAGKYEPKPEEDLPESEIPDDLVMEKEDDVYELKRDSNGDGINDEVYCTRTTTYEYEAKVSYEYLIYSYVQYQYKYTGEDGGDLKNAAMKSVTSTISKMDAVSLTGEEAMTKLLFPYPIVIESEEAELDSTVKIENHGDAGSKNNPNDFTVYNGKDAVRYYRSNDLSLKVDVLDNETTNYYYKEHLFITTSAENIIKALHDFYSQGDKDNDSVERRNYDESFDDVSSAVETTQRDEDGNAVSIDKEQTTQKIADATKDSLPEEYFASPYKPVRDLIQFFADANVLDSLEVYGAAGANAFAAAAKWFLVDTNYTIENGPTGSTKVASINTSGRTEEIEVLAPLAGVITIDDEGLVSITTPLLGTITFNNIVVAEGLDNMNVSQGQVIGTVKLGENLLYSRTDETGSEVTDAVTEVKNLLAKEKAKYAWPAPSTTNISSDFGPRPAPKEGASTYHRGLDFSASQGTAIVSFADGEIVSIGIDTGDGKGYGNTVAVYHEELNMTSFYAHMERPCTLELHAKVKKGQTIGWVGSTGVSTGPHLHFELHTGNSIDSSTAFNPEPKLLEAGYSFTVNRD